MNTFVDRKIKALFIKLFISLLSFFISFILMYKANLENKLFYYSFLFLIFSLLIFFFLISYFKKRNKIIEDAKKQVQNYIIEKNDKKIFCDDEGEIYKLFHEINSLTSILSAHVEKELKAKEFLKGIIFDISHQIKTPIAALNIYNGIIKQEAEDIKNEVIEDFTNLSDKELDRIEILIKNLLTIAKFDTETITMNKKDENLYNIVNIVRKHFNYRLITEEKKLLLSGDKNMYLYCDKTWIIEAISNIVKNSLDHTKSGDSILIEWKKLGSIIQILIRDNGTGIHEEDINYIFKRFYRSRYSKDTEGVGLGLPLTKSVIQGHNGIIDVDSRLDVGTIFTINFLIPTKL